MPMIPIPGFSEPFSCWSHFIPAALSAVGLYFLLQRGKGSKGRISSLIIFSFSLVFLFSMSGVYHLLEPGGVPRAVFQKLDHAAIWVLIAGTFTPIHAILFRGAWRWGILMLVWFIAITGLVLEVVFFSSIPEWMTLSFFLGLGWIGVISGWKFKKIFGDDSSRLLLLGGIFYSIGAVMEFLRWPDLIPGIIGPHEVFHIFVIGGALSHWLFVYRWAAHPIRNTITFHIKVFPENKYFAKAIGESLELEASSLEDLREDIKTEVDVSFHKSLRPKIHLKYFNEEIL